jgi:hypothetical protein
MVQRSQIQEFKFVLEIFKLLGKILNEIADIEEKEGKRIDEILKERLSPAELLNLSQKLPPELYAKLISAFLRVATLSQLQNPWILPPVEKRKLASELEKIAQELKEVLEGVS